MIGQFQRRLILSVRFAVPTAAVLFAGCGSVLTSDSPAERVYWLEPLNADAVTWTDAAPQPKGLTLGLTIDAAPGLDTDRVLVLESDARLNEYAAARWPDRATTVIAYLLKTSIEANNPSLRVVVPPPNPVADVLLALELSRFFAHNGEVQVELRGHLRCGNDVHIVAARSSTPIADERLAIIVAAFQSAVDDAFEGILRSVGETGCFEEPTTNRHRPPVVDSTALITAERPLPYRRGLSRTA